MERRKTIWAFTIVSRLVIVSLGCGCVCDDDAGCGCVLDAGVVDPTSLFIALSWDPTTGTSIAAVMSNDTLRGKSPDVHYSQTLRV